MSEAKLDITGSSAVAQRENDKLTKTVANLREQVRQLNATTRESKKDADSWSAGMEQLKQSTDKWTAGMANLQRQIGATKRDFSVLNSAMQKTVQVKDPFGPWVKGLENVKAAAKAVDRWTVGLRELGIQQGAKRADFSVLLSAMSKPVESKGEVFAPWAKGLENLRAQNDKWAAGIRVLQAQNMKPGAAGPSATSLFRDALKAEAIEQVSASLGSVASRMVGIGAAVGVVTAGYQAWAHQVSKTAQAHDELSLSIVKTLAETGGLAMGPEAEKFSKSVSGATPKQAIAALAGVRQSGETLKDERAFSVAREIAKLAPTGIDLTQAGALSADVADVVGEGTSAENVANLTVGLKQQLRGKTDLFSGPKFQKQMERLKRNTGMDGIDALAYAVVAAQSEGGAEALSVAGMRPGDRSYDQRKMYKSVFSPEAIAEAKANLQGYQTQGMAGRELASLGSFAAGREALSQQQLAIQEAKTDEQMGPLAAERQRIRDFARQKAWQKGSFTGVVAEIASGAYSPVSGLVDLVQGQESAGIGQVNTMRANGTISDQKANEMISALREAAAASRAAAKANSSRNVDAHTE